MDVVILAGGVGRRFGGEKQFVEVGPAGETLYEITLADAECAGCRRAVIVVSPEGDRAVRERLAARPPGNLAVAVVVQRLDDLPAAVETFRDRPWGTAHALWAARHALDGPFLLFNADDHYGPRAPALLMAALDQAGPGPGFAMLGYPLEQTLSADGAVSRAVCETDDAGRLTGLTEYTDIDRTGQVVAGAAAGRILPREARVSMNAWAFTPDIFPLLEGELTRFLVNADLERAECFLPTVVDGAVRRGEARVRVVDTRERWLGLTWPEDRSRVAAELKTRADVREAVSLLGLEPGEGWALSWNRGLIHRSWVWDSRDGAFLLQRLNGQVFPCPETLAESAALAARRVDAALAAGGDRDPRHRLEFLTAPDGRPWVRDAGGAVWRASRFIAGSRPANPESPAEIRSAAAALGRFPGLLAAGPGPAPVPALPAFHDTPARMDRFSTVLADDVRARAAGSRAVSDGLQALSHLAGRLESRGLPERLVHNDAKLDNVLVSIDAGEALCVIDLDTVMPGLAAHDFGDLVRSSVTARPEDEPDRQWIRLRMDIFSSLAEGYVTGARDWLTAPEKASLVDGALVITFEQALRFLTDHLAGDVYYPVAFPGHNLRRARAQLILLENLLAVEDELRALIDRI